MIVTVTSNCWQRSHSVVHDQKESRQSRLFMEPLDGSHGLLAALAVGSAGSCLTCFLLLFASAPVSAGLMSGDALRTCTTFCGVELLANSFSSTVFRALCAATLNISSTVNSAARALARLTSFCDIAAGHTFEIRGRLLRDSVKNATFR